MGSQFFIANFIVFSLCENLAIALAFEEKLQRLFLMIFSISSLNSHDLKKLNGKGPHSGGIVSRQIGMWSDITQALPVQIALGKCDS